MTTDEQHTEVMRTLNALARQGQAIRRELSKLAQEVDSVKSLVSDLEALDYQILMRFDE